MTLGKFHFARNSIVESEKGAKTVIADADTLAVDRGIIGVLMIEIDHTMFERLKVLKKWGK